MEIRLVERNPKTKRIKNVEIYSEESFFKLVMFAVKYAVLKAGFWKLISKDYRTLGSYVKKYLKIEFKDRIAKNLNK